MGGDRMKTQMRIIIYYGICFVLFFCFCYQLPAGEIKLVKQVSLDDLGIFKPTFLKVHLGNTYIYDEAQMTFFIINNEFKLLKKFGRRGSGPGEYQIVVTFGFSNNRLWVTDAYGRMIWYDLNGEFREEKKQTKMLSLVLEQIDADRYFVLDNQIESNRDRIQSFIYVTGSERIKLVEIREPLKLTMDLEERINFSFAAAKNSCYVLPSDKRYYIRRFDIARKVFTGEIEKKNFQRIKYNEMEIAEYNEKIKKYLESNPNYKQFTIKSPVLKPAVKGIYSDEMERVYIISYTSQKGKNSLEIYDKTLKYQDVYIIPAFNLVFPTSDCLYLVISDENEEIYWLQAYSLLPRCD